MFDRKAYVKKWCLENKEKINKRSREWYLANKDRKKKTVKEWNKKNPEKRRIISKRWATNTRPDYFKIYNRKKAREFRLLIVKNYGGKCTCCGETAIEFLALDHVNGDGNKERKALRTGGSSFYYHVIRQGYPERYRLLCHNCNMARGLYGYCPHSKGKTV